MVHTLVPLHERHSNQKRILCTGTEDKIILCRVGYFNLVNGYKAPFTTGKDSNGHHIYLPGTSIQHLNALKEFDDELRMILLKYITKAEEEVRTFSAYKFDELNKKGSVSWYQINAIIPFISPWGSKAYSEISRSQLDYVKFYMENHKVIPSWILTKAINFSTFIDFVNFSKPGMKNALCQLYNLVDSRGYNDYKLLIGSLHWMRRVRNVCAHNERVYTVNRNKGRLIEKYLKTFPSSYQSEREQRLIDLLFYLKYYLDTKDYENMVCSIKLLLDDLESKIHSNAFAKVRAEMGIKDVKHLDILFENTKIIEYNKF